MFCMTQMTIHMYKVNLYHRRPKLTIREIDRINDLCRRANDLCKRMSDLCKRIEWDVTTSSARCCVTI